MLCVLLLAPGGASRSERRDGEKWEYTNKPDSKNPNTRARSCKLVLAFFLSDKTGLVFTLEPPLAGVCGVSLLVKSLQRDRHHISMRAAVYRSYAYGA